MLKQYLNLKISQRLSPQQIQLMSLLQLPTQAFEQRLLEEFNENPALEGELVNDNNDSEFETDEFEGKDEFDNNDEFDGQDDNDNYEADDLNLDEYITSDEIPDYKTQTNNYSDDDEERESPLSAPLSFHQDLINQLNTFILTDDQRDIAEFLVGSIDDMGYIRRSIQDIVDDMAFTQGIYTDEKTVEKVLHIVQRLDPPGVGARDLQECLLLQLKYKTPTESIEIAINIVEKYFEAFTKKHYEKLLLKLEISKEQLRKAFEEIEKLNPKPGGIFTGSTKTTEHVVPDFTIRVVDDELELTLNGRNAPELHVSKDYQEMMKTYRDSKDKSDAQKNAVLFIKQKLDSAKWFIDAVRQRQETLYVTMSVIMDFQKEYFIDGDEAKLRPMILKDIADRIGVDVSTVSRVASSKYVDTPYGTKLLKDFFSEAIVNNQGEEISTIEIKRLITEMVNQEDKKKPLMDDQITEMLKEKGFTIARRTVAKYRELLEIPVARMRKKI